MLLADIEAVFVPVMANDLALGNNLTNMVANRFLGTLSDRIDYQKLFLPIANARFHNGHNVAHAKIA